MLKNKINDILINFVGKPYTKETIHIAQQQIENLFREEDLTVYLWLRFNDKTRTLTLSPIDKMSAYILKGIYSE